MKTAKIVAMLCFVGWTSLPGLAAPPAYDHIVVVIEENKA